MLSNIPRKKMNANQPKSTLSKKYFEWDIQEAKENKNPKNLKVVNIGPPHIRGGMRTIVIFSEPKARGRRKKNVPKPHPM
jgi:hypothetical protein